MEVRLDRTWRLWDQFALRGPGFPANGVLRLAPDGLAAAADKFDEQLTGPDWAAFEEEFGAAAVQTARELQDIAARPDFRAAVAWQNRPVLTTGIKPFLAWTPTAAGRTSMPRQREELVAHYWQRFCVKNDTIGFFGPVGWGRWDLGQPDIEVDPGDSLIAQITVYFASWAIDTLARTLEPELRQWIAPRRVPFVHIGQTEVTIPGRPPQPITADQHRLLTQCDGTRSAHHLARANPDLDVPALLAELVSRRWLVWRLEVPADAHPERWLRSWLATVEDEPQRARAEAALDLLEQGRSQVAAATDADALAEALTRLEQDFLACTDTAAVREKSAGTAPCRALVYADCRRTATATAGHRVLAGLAPLPLLLTSANWLTATLADRVLHRAEEVFDRLAATGPVNLAEFWFACMPILHGAAVEDASELQQEFQRRWQTILDPANASRVWRSTEDIEHQVELAFGNREPGWTAARYLSPDILLTGNQFVLGELHLATNSLGSSLFVNQHPDQAELLARTTRDHPGPRLLPLLPKEHRSRLSARTRQSLVRPEDHYVALVDHTADPARPRTHASADILVERHDTLSAVLPDGTRFPVIDVFGHVLTTLAMDLFRLAADAPHTPRITIDDLVVARETWRFPAAEITAAEEKSEPRRFVRLRQWRETHSLPRFVFLTCPTEPRPFYVDFDSPVYLNILAKAIRRLARKDPAGQLTVTEMLPAPDQAWLPDHNGESYTAELRFVAVADPQ
ncbi:lantibiotic dehydratase [Crossiella sp. CA-258035]|uniref:lantibiotic dehydratase n=1 Tax=Crossiella sp. CA-258035 TaxID=2981138 RepID=UPI0024BC7BEF|nr:lantibiotic dehydratase [Crossiella sp. CA-258035]WHT22384.1 lantibiotic dehydratase [Crossiella sp. CA-258035]